MATKKRDRAVAGFFAGLFIVSSCILTVAVIYAMVQGDDPAETSINQTEEGNMDNANKLEGTQLANYTPGTSIPELKTEVLSPGNGDEVKPGDTVTVDYTGAVAATGIIFQSSKDTGQPVSFPLSGVIAGWSQGIPGMKVGETRRLLIPANLAYADSPPSGSNIPPNADLVFDVTLHKIGQ